MTLLPLPTPDAVVGVGRSLLGWAGEAVDVAARLPARVDGLLDEATRLVGVLGDVADRVDVLLGRADGLVDDLDTLLVRVQRVAGEAEDALGSVRTVSTGAEEVVASARSVSAGAAEVVESAGGTSRGAQELLVTYQPMLEHGAPLAEKFIADLTTDEVDAAIRLVDQLPVLTESMVTDVMPILATLDRVGPDIHELLGVTKELRQAIDGIPGLSFLKKRGAAKDDEDD